MKKPDLRVRIGNYEFSNPCLVASGTYGWGENFPSVISKVGGFITKGLTLSPREGNPPPRIWEVKGGIVNSIGLENPGAIYFVNNILPNLKKLPTKIIANLAGSSVEEFETLVKILDLPEIYGFELNLSCPNVKEGGIFFSLSPKSAQRVIRATRRLTKKLLIAKLSPCLTDLLALAHLCAEEGVDALTLINSLPALVISSETFKPCLGGKTGGLSGPFLKPFVLFCIQKVKEVVSIPIIGCGGITNYSDALEYLITGASLFQVGSQNLLNPFTPLEIIEGIKRYLKEKEIWAVEDLINKLEV
ncbi:MAG: dihydroorotate dehydrogenase [candidate division WOR-3 bacterium]